MARALPTGIVTSLFTDIEGSTRLLHQLGDGYAQAQRSFHEALERAHTSGTISLELLAPSGDGALLRATGEPERAGTVLTVVLGHEQLPPSSGFAARPVLGALEAELSPEQLAAARTAAAGAELEAIVADALAAAA